MRLVLSQRVRVGDRWIELPESSIGIPEADAVEHLRRLVESDPVASRDGGGYQCHYCYGPAAMVPNLDYAGLWVTVIDHRPDCPHVAARAFLESLGTPAEPGA